MNELGNRNKHISMNHTVWNSTQVNHAEKSEPHMEHFLLEKTRQRTTHVSIDCFTKTTYEDIFDFVCISPVG